MAVYPTINANGIVTQLPYTETDEWVVAESSIEAGISTTLTQHGSRLRRFVLNYPMIQRDEVTVLENFFDSMRGGLGQFDFVDDDNNSWICRFDMDYIEFQYEQWNHYSTVVKLITVGEGL